MVAIQDRFINLVLFCNIFISFNEKIFQMFGHPLILTAYFLLLLNLSYSQTIWTGQISSDWNNPMNWSPSAVPDSATNVDIILNASNPQPFWPKLLQPSKVNRLRCRDAQFNFNNFPLSCNWFVSLDSEILTGTDSAIITVFDNPSNLVHFERSRVNGNLSISTNNNHFVQFEKSVFKGVLIYANASKVTIIIQDSCYFSGNLVIQRPASSFRSSGSSGIRIWEAEITGDLNIMDEVSSALSLGAFDGTRPALGLRVMGKINIVHTRLSSQTEQASFSIRQLVNYQQGGKIFAKGHGNVWISQDSLRVDSIYLFPSVGAVWLDSNVIYCPITQIQSNETRNGPRPESRLGGNTFYGSLFFTDTLNEIQETRGFGKIGVPLNTEYGYPNFYYGDVYFKGKLNLGMFDTSSFHSNLTIETLDGSVFHRARFTGDQTSSVSIGETPLQNGIIDKTSGANVSLISPLNISGLLRFNNGNLQTNPNSYLKFLHSATAEGFGIHSYVNGEVRKVGNSVFTFPTGSESAFKPFSISAPADPSEIVGVKYNSTSPVSLTDTSRRGLGLHSIGNCEVWEVNHVVGNSLVTVAPAWAIPCLDDSIYLANPQNVQVARWDGVVWQNEGNGGYNNGMISSSNATSPSGLFTFAAPQQAIDTTEPPQLPSMVIFPNPVTQILNINVEQGYKQGIIIDAIGRTLSTHYIQAGVNSIDVRHLPSGVYFLKLITARTQKVLSWIKI